MADDDQLAPEEGLEPEAVPAEGEAEAQTNDADDPIAKLATEIGWTPKDQFKGDPEKWKPADQFIRDGREIQHSMSRELKEVKETVSNMARVSETLMEQQLRERDAYWQAKQEEAFENGDRDAFKVAEREREKLTTAAPSGPSPEVKSFAERNAWFRKDPIATNFAVQVCELNKNLPVDEQLRLAETEVRKRFPEHFPAPAKAAPTVSAPASRGGGKPAGRTTFNDMPVEAQKMAIHLEETRGVSRDKYVASWFKQQGAVQ